MYEQLFDGRLKDSERLRIDFLAKPAAIPAKIEELPTPSSIVAKLDKYVVGQLTAKKALAVAYVNHLAAVEYEKRNPGAFPLAKQTLFMIGPSGSGKTYLLDILAKELDVDVLVCDASSYTKAGYKGNDVSTILSDYRAKCNGSESRMAKGIIFMDEIDKMRNGDDLELNGVQVQRELLKVIESQFQEEFGVTPMWVFGGSFSEYLKIRMKDFGVKKKVGFVSGNVDAPKFEFDDQELIRSGFIPEFVGRVGRIVTLDPLTKDDFKAILKSVEGSLLYHYEKLGEMRKINLKLSAADIKLVIDAAFKDGIGARALKKHTEKLLADRMYV